MILVEENREHPEWSIWADLDLGSAHWFKWLWGAEVNQNFDPANPEENHRPIGGTDYHRKTDGTLHAGAVIFDIPDAAPWLRPGQTGWTVNSWLPLDLSPSLLCSCGDHGFIRGGIWVP